MLKVKNCKWSDFSQNRHRVAEYVSFKRGKIQFIYESILFKIKYKNHKGIKIKSFIND